MNQTELLEMLKNEPPISSSARIIAHGSLDKLLTKASKIQRKAQKEWEKSGVVIADAKAS